MKKVLLTAFALALFIIYILTVQTEAPAPLEPVGLEQAIINSCVFESSVDVSQYNLSKAAMESSFMKLYSAGRLPWYTAATFHYLYEEQSGTVVEFTPDTLNRDAKAKALYEQKVAEILNECVIDGMSQHQIALSIHDYLATNTVYDHSLARNTGYDLIVNGSAVCAGYSEAYQDLLSRVGIQSVCVTSNAMTHEWNLVQIDGQWYHVDVTWAVSSLPLSGYVNHDYFLLTDAEIASGSSPHYGWSSDVQCTNTRFCKAFWRNVDGRILFLKKDECVFAETAHGVSNLYLFRAAQNEKTLLLSETAKSVPFEGQLIYVQPGLSYANGRIFFNTTESLLSFLPDGSDVSTEYIYDPQGVNEFVCGSGISGDGAYLVISRGNSTKKLPVPLSGRQFHAHQYTETAHAPTCAAAGFLEFSCSCGLSYQCDYKAPSGHVYQRTNYNLNPFITNKHSVWQCEICGDSVSVVLPTKDFWTFVICKLSAILSVASLVVLCTVSIIKKSSGKKHPS